MGGAGKFVKLTIAIVFEEWHINECIVICLVLNPPVRERQKREEKRVSDCLDNAST